MPAPESAFCRGGVRRLSAPGLFPVPPLEVSRRDAVLVQVGDGDDQAPGMLRELLDVPLAHAKADYGDLQFLHVPAFRNERAPPLAGGNGE